MKGTGQEKKRPAVTPERAQEQDTRRKRLADALRNNLRKRKTRQSKQGKAV